MGNIYQQCQKNNVEFFLFTKARFYGYFYWKMGGELIRYSENSLEDDITKLDLTPYHLLGGEKPKWEVVESYSEMLKKILEVLGHLEEKSIGLFSRPDCAGDNPINCNLGSDYSPDKFIVDEGAPAITDTLIKRISESKELSPIELEGDKLLNELIEEQTK